MAKGAKENGRCEQVPGADDVFCQGSENLRFRMTDDEEMELVGLSHKMLSSVPLNGIKLNFNGELIDIKKIHPDRCAVEFRPPEWSGHLGEDVPVHIVVDGKSIHSVTYQHSSVIGVTEPAEGEMQATVNDGSFAGWQERTLAWLRGDNQRRHVLLEQCIAEFFGTMFIVIFGVGVVCTAVLTGAQQGIFQIAVVWGFGVGFAIYSTASISGAHLNPAVSLAFAMFRPLDFPWRRLLPFWLAQMLGGMAGGAINLGIFRRWYDFRDPERNNVLYAATFGEYFPNPGLFGGEEFYFLMTPVECMLVEAWGTGVLMFMILAFTDDRNKALKSKDAAPFLIGFTVACLISLYAPLQQAGWNPARDFGPRIIAAIFGWGRVAIPGPRDGFWTYIVGPLIGAPGGALVYDMIFARGLRERKDPIILDTTVHVADKDV